MKPKTLNLIQLNVAVALWGGTAMFAKGVDLPISHIICTRSLIAAAALWMFMLAVKIPVRMNRPGHYGVILLLGVLLCLHWLTYFAALRISTAAVAILALHTYPVFTALVEPFVFGEKLRRIDIALAAIVLAGVLIMTPQLSLTNEITLGIVLGVVSGLFFMARNLLVRKWVKQYTSSTLMFWQVLVTGLVLVPVLAWPAKAEYTLPVTGKLLLLGAVFTALPQTLFAASFANLSAKTVGILATLLPFYAAFWGYVIHNEAVTTRTAVGGAVILACILFETVRSVKQR